MISIDFIENIYCFLFDDDIANWYTIFLRSLLCDAMASPHRRTKSMRFTDGNIKELLDSQCFTVQVEVSQLFFFFLIQVGAFFYVQGLELEENEEIDFALLSFSWIRRDSFSDQHFFVIYYVSLVIILTL